MNELLPDVFFLAHLAATLCMTGVIWFVQVVHYPLFAVDSSAGYVDYQRRHMARTTRVVGPLMLVEAATAIPLFGFRPAGVVSAWRAVERLSRRPGSRSVSGNPGRCG